MIRGNKLPSIFFYSFFALPLLLIPASSGQRAVRWAYIYHGAPVQKKALDKRSRKYDIFALTGFRLTAKGRIVTPRGRRFSGNLAGVKNSRRIWYPVISPASPRQGEKFLTSPAAVARALADLSVLVKRQSLTGLHFDFEYLKGGYAPHLADFFRKVKKHLPGISVSMAIFPPLDFPSKWNRLHDPALLAPVLDKAVVMCYDYHRPGGPRGPVTSVRWAEKNIRYLLKFFKPEQLYLGIPAYGYLREPAGGSLTLSARYVSLCRKCTVSRHRKSGTLAVKNNRQGKVYRGYVADRVTRQKMKALARRYALRGTALWRLGFQEINEVN